MFYIFKITKLILSNFGQNLFADLYVSCLCKSMHIRPDEPCNIPLHLKVVSKIVHIFNIGLLISNNFSFVI